MKSSQSFLPFIGIEEHLFSSNGEDKRPLGNIINQNQKMDEILFETTILPLEHQQYDISSNENINKLTSRLNNITMSEKNTTTAYNPTANQKINVMNQPIISNNINVINPSNIKQNPLYNSTSQKKFNPSQSLSYSSIQPSDSSATLINFNSKMNRSSINMNYDNDLTSLSTTHILSPCQIPANQNPIPHDLSKHAVFYNSTSSFNSTIHNNINKTFNLINSSETSPSSSFTRQPIFYNPNPTSPINSLETNTLSNLNSSSPQSVSNNNYSNFNDVITSTTPNTLPRYPPSVKKSPSSTSSSTRFNRQYEERNKTLPRTSKKAEQPKKKFQSLPRYNSYKVTITRFKSIFSNNNNKNKVNTIIQYNSI